MIRDIILQIIAPVSQKENGDPYILRLLNLTCGGLSKADPPKSSHLIYFDVN
jgi:hypothetical protein